MRFSNYGVKNNLLIEKSAVEALSACDILYALDNRTKVCTVYSSE